MSYTLWQGDCLSILPTLEAGSVDSIVCDPPYGLSFMGKDWDHGVPGVAFWEAALRVAKPGAMLLAFGGTRTHHRLTVAIEDAGWQVRDCLMWLYGSGFPKSHNLGNGWGTALKPAWEPIVMAMKPLDGTFANNALVHGVGGINVDACRIGTGDRLVAGGSNKPMSGDTRTGKALGMFQPGTPNTYEQNPQGRWPANLLLDEEAAAMLDAQSGERPSRPAKAALSGQGSGDNHSGENGWGMKSIAVSGYVDAGGASRFFYVAKASKRDRDEGLEGMELREAHKMSGGECIAEGRTAAKGKAMARNFHPTVKPTQLMRYLVRLVTPTGGMVLDPFCGSGSTGKAAVLEGFSFIGCEIDPTYHALAQKRISEAAMQLPLLEVQP